MSLVYLSPEQRFSLLRIATWGLVLSLLSAILGIAGLALWHFDVPGSLVALASVCATALGQMVVPTDPAPRIEARPPTASAPACPAPQAN